MVRESSARKLVLWDTRHLGAQKDFAGGMGVGMFPPRRGLRALVIRRFFERDRRPPPLHFAYLAAIARRLGWKVEYALDRDPRADVYVFHPSLITLEFERAAMRRLRARDPQARIWVIGQVAHSLSSLFEDCGVTVIRGEPEALWTQWDRALELESGTLHVGSVADLDFLPFPDWSVFPWRTYRVAYDFWRFPTAFIQQSRGCTFSCNYCPYIITENKTRFRSPDSVLEEIDRGVRHFGFQSFKFRDPLFGLDRQRALALAEGLARRKPKVQFSVETRIDLMRDETLDALARAGLTSITVGIETPDESLLRRHDRLPIRDDRQRQFINRCRQLGVRTVAGFMVGFLEDTPESVMRVLHYARELNPTFANFNMVTPYPGTSFYHEIQPDIQDHDLRHYNVYQPVLKYRHVSRDEMAELHTRCFTKYYFRSRYLAENRHLLWPRLFRRPLAAYGPARAA